MHMDNTLKQADGRERLRGPSLAMLVKSANRVPMEEALRRADEAGLVIASNKRIDQALYSSEGWKSKVWKSIIDAFPLWTGTLVAYEEPGRCFGKTFEFTECRTKNRYVLEVPEEHRGKADVVLVAEHPNFTIEQDGRTRIIHAKEVGILTNVPAVTGGWYLGDPVHDIPSGKRVDKRSEAARLIVRGYSDFSGFFDPYSVCLGHRPSDCFGVVVEGTPEQIAARLPKLDK
jgi:hypothetical protein